MYTKRLCTRRRIHVKLLILPEFHNLPTAQHPHTNGHHTWKNKSQFVFVSPKASVIRRKLVNSNEKVFPKHWDHKNTQMMTKREWKTFQRGAAMKTIFRCLFSKWHHAKELLSASCSLCIKFIYHLLNCILRS